MSTIKKLTLKLKSGLLSELHSDTVMGHFCWRLRDYFGDDKKVTEFISLYQKSDSKPPFTISNVLLEKNGELFYPKPFLHIKESEIKAEGKKDKIVEFLLNKELKSVELLTTDQFNLAINGRVQELYNSLINDKLERPKFVNDLKVSVEIDRDSFSARDGQLFSYHPKFLDDNTRVVFLIKVLNEKSFDDFRCGDILKNVFEIGFGKKKSSGYGQFEVIGDLKLYEKIKKPQNSNAFITLGNYLPSADDGIITECNYDFIVKYGRLSEEKSLSSNPFKKPLILFTPGSVFKTEKIKEQYGKVTQSGDISEFDLDAVQFGMPFTLNFKSL